jgi:rubrerythrin
MSTRLDFAKLSLMDALDLAILIEIEAHQRYKVFAAQLGHRGPGDASSFFKLMAENEAKHGEQLAERRKKLFGDIPVKVSLDDLFDVEAPDMGEIRSTMSTRQAYQVGLAAEQKAYYFYDEALGHITHPEIRALFTELRDEETEHVRMLEEGMAKLPESADFEGEIDHDESPYL